MGGHVQEHQAAFGQNRGPTGGDPGHHLLLPVSNGGAGGQERPASAPGHELYTGISAPLLIGKITRLAGGDFQINGHPFGKFPVPYKVFYRCFKFFTQPWWNIKPMMYACSGGTTQLAVEKIIKAVGTDVMLAAGGGVHGHPDGSEAGAKSMRQAIDAAMLGIPVTEYAKDHPELARMLGHLNPDLKKNFDLMN